MRYYEATGNLHVHTAYSDGTGLHRDVAEAAARAGLDFIIVTDHNVWVKGVEGYYDRVLLLVGEEVHHVQRDPQANHLLIYAAEAEMVLEAAEPQALINAVREKGGFCFLAHPFEKGSPISADLAPIDWVDWEVEGYAGLEIWNTMSELKGLSRNRLLAILYAYMPSLGFRGPFRATLRQWDKLLAARRKVAAIGGADAHAEAYRMGPLRRTVYPYEDLFRWVNTHVLIERPLNGDLNTDRQLIYDSLRSGRTWVGYDRLSPTQGFRFQARSGTTIATLGEELSRVTAVIFEIEAPQSGDIRLLRDGKTAARRRGNTLRFTTAEPGAYRVEVRRTFRGRRRGWIYTSPIYIV